MPNPKTKILVIEDDKPIVDLLRENIDPDTYQVVFSIEAEAGFLKAKKEKPDLILLDVLLPEKSGFEILKKLKKNLQTKDIPVIILSNLGQDREIRVGLKLGAIDYLVKADFTIGEVIKKITNILKRKNK